MRRLPGRLRFGSGGKLGGTIRAGRVSTHWAAFQRRRLARARIALHFTFEWDSEKARLNLEKHGVTFDEAATAFSDHLSSTIGDPDQSDDENRFLLIGMSSRGRLVVVAHAERGDRIRLINARLASNREKKQYEEEHA